jgi:glycosyltransferase involved in cell wall biosynthesis
MSLVLERTLRSSHSLKQRLVARVELARTRRYEAALGHRFDRMVVTSPDDAGALQALAPTANLRVIPNGVDLEHFRPLDGPREPATLVFSGKMSYHANVTAVRYFVDAILPLIRRTHPSVRVRIIGSNPPKTITALASDPAITVTGYVADVPSALAGATLAICPVTVKVGIQNKVLEAMAMGIPVVSTEAGAAGLAATPGRDLLVADTPASFAEQVGRMLDDSVARDALARAGRSYVEAEHRWEVAARRLETLYVESVEAHAFARTA